MTFIIFYRCKETCHSRTDASLKRKKKSINYCGNYTAFVLKCLSTCKQYRECVSWKVLWSHNVSIIDKVYRQSTANNHKNWLWKVFLETRLEFDRKTTRILIKLLVCKFYTRKKKDKWKIFAIKDERHSFVLVVVCNSYPPLWSWF